MPDQENSPTFVRDTIEAMLETRKNRDEAIAEFQKLRQGLAEHRVDPANVSAEAEMDDILGADLKNYLLGW
jgi:hypothetical protein